MRGLPKSRPRVAIFAPFPPPFRVPLYNALAQLPDIDTTLLITNTYGEYGKETTNWNFKQTTLPHVCIPIDTPRFGRTVYEINPTLPLVLLRGRYDVVITYCWPRSYSILARILGRVAGFPVVLWEESIPHPANWLKAKLEPLMRRYISGFDGWLVVSSLAGDYFRSYGADRKRVYLFPQTADVELFRAANYFSPDERCAIRQRFDVGEDTLVVCFVGQIIQRKGVLRLAEAFHQVIKGGANAQLFIAGKGELEDAVKAYVTQHYLSDRINILGPLLQKQLVDLYAISDVFVLPSEYDTFGAVVLEAMASGLPIITTNRVGAAYDLVEEGVNGRIVVWDNTEAMAEAMRCILSDDETRKQMGDASLAKLKTWNIEATIEGYRRAVFGVLGASSATGAFGKATDHCS